MEAVAKYAYAASSPSELSFNAGDTMKVCTAIILNKKQKQDNYYS